QRRRHARAGGGRQCHCHALRSSACRRQAVPETADRCLFQHQRCVRRAIAWDAARLPRHPNSAGADGRGYRVGGKAALRDGRCNIADRARRAFGFWRAWPLLAEWLTENGNGEPMALFEGISLWPTILLRALGAGLTFWLICYTRRSPHDNKAETDKKLGLVESSRTLCQEWERIRSDANSYPTRTAQIAALLWFRRAPPGPGERPEGKFEQIVGAFALGWQARCIRAAIGTAAMFALWIILAQ